MTTATASFPPPLAWAPSWKGRPDLEQKLVQLYDQLQGRDGQEILVEELYTERQSLVIGNDDIRPKILLQYGKIASPYLTPLAPPTNGSFRDILSHFFSGDGDLEISTRKAACLTGRWFESNSSVYIVYEHLQRKKIILASEAYVTDKPFEKYFGGFGGCTSMIQSITTTVHSCSFYIGDEVKKFFAGKRMILEDDKLQLVEKDTQKIYSRLKAQIEG